MLLLAFPAFADIAVALDASHVAVVINTRSSISRSIGEYYSIQRRIPKENIITISTAEIEEIARDTYEREIARPVAKWLSARRPTARVDAIVLTKGVPLKIRGAGSGMSNDAASVDSELAALRLSSGKPFTGPLKNPYYGSRDAFDSSRFPIYLVTRLDGYTFADIKGLIDRSLQARDRGIVVLDAKSSADDGGDHWLRSAARRLPEQRVRADYGTEVLSSVRDVIGYASWGSNDKARRSRDVHFTYLPGAIVTEYVSTDGRTFKEPPAAWEITTWENRSAFYAGSPQSLSADFIRQGATGVSGHAYEPYLAFTPRPDFLFPAYVVEHRTLAESFWSSIPAVSWMNVVVGDPLCRLAP